MKAFDSIPVFFRTIESKAAVGTGLQGRVVWGIFEAYDTVCPPTV